MTGKQEKTPPSSTENAKELAETQLEEVSGGFNPQPEPPGAFPVQDMLRRRVRSIAK